MPVQMSPPYTPATSLVPSAEDVRGHQFRPLNAVPVVRLIQVTPESEEVQMSLELKSSSIAANLVPSEEEVMSLLRIPTIATSRSSASRPV